MSISIPLQINKKGFVQQEDEKKSIDEAMRLLIQSPRYSCVADPQYGFIFKNLRFEIFNENEGTVYTPDESSRNLSWKDRLYKMKVSGTSKNVNTFASELKNVIEIYEPRLEDVTVSLTYIREEKIIYVTVKGVIIASRSDYDYETKIKIWK